MTTIPRVWTKAEGVTVNRRTIDQERYRRAKELLPEVRRILFAHPGEGEIRLADGLHATLVINLYARMRSLFEAVTSLLDAGLPEEGLFLARSMLSDSMTLMDLEANPAQREPKAAWWFNQTINRLEGLGRESQAAGLARAADWEPAIAKLRQGLEETKSQLGIDHLTAIKGESDLARDLGLTTTYWDFKFMSEMIHRADLALGMRTKKGEDNVVRMGLRNYDPGQFAAVATSTMESALRALTAVASIFQWSDVPSDEISRLLAELDSLFDHLDG